MSKPQLLAMMATLLTVSVSAMAAPRLAMQPGSAFREPRNVRAAAEMATRLPCYNFADPDNGVGNECMCYNGAVLPTAPMTGTNTGSNYNPCPYTAAPAPSAAPARRDHARSGANATTTATPTASALPCYNFADPDNGVGDYCMCSNGISTAVASATGNNTGSHYQPCPYTVAPTSQETPVPTAGQTTTKHASVSTVCTSTEETWAPKTTDPRAGVNRDFY